MLALEFCVNRSVRLSFRRLDMAQYSGKAHLLLFPFFPPAPKIGVLIIVDSERNQPGTNKHSVRALDSKTRDPATANEWNEHCCC